MTKASPFQSHCAASCAVKAQRTGLSLGALVGMSTLLSACHADIAEQGPVIDVAVQAIANERSGGVAEVIGGRYASNPDVTLASYATADMDGCSATMIGPNFVMSAAHCGAFAHNLTFRTYRDGSRTLSDTETFRCEHLIQTFPETDLLLLHCAPNAAGESPGDKYGYLDLDASLPRVGQNLYSIWTNPVDSLGLPSAQIYSAGQVTSTTSRGWFTWFDSAAAVESNLWTQPGASGSSGINPVNHRILLGPTSVGVATEGPWRAGLSVRDYLWHGYVDATAPFNRNIPALTALGLDPAAYPGPIDKDWDDLFDVQTDAERLHGENRRDHYWLGFESPRRNALWTVSNTSIDSTQRWAFVSAPGAGPALTHAKLPLLPETRYRVTLMTYVATAQAGTLIVRLIDPSAKERTVDEHRLALTEIGAWQMHSFTLDTGTHEDAQFSIETSAAVQAYVLAPSLIEDGSIMDFDSADKRVNWRNNNDGSRALITPDGRTSGAPDLAARVFRDTRYTLGNDWSLRNRQLALQPTHWNRVCFDAKTFQSPDHAGRARLANASAVVLSLPFAVTGTWQTHCSDWFRPTSEDNNLLFGNEAAKSGYTYLVDNLRIELGGNARSVTGPNLLFNANFETIGPAGATTRLADVVGENSPGQSGADRWTLYANSLATMTTEHLSLGAHGASSAVLHVDVTAAHTGLVQVFLAQHTGPACAVGRARVYVLHGSVALGLGDGGNSSLLSETSATGRWVWLEAENTISPVNEIVIYSTSDDGAEFFVDEASVHACTS